MKSAFKSGLAKAVLSRWHDHFRSRLPVPTGARWDELMKVAIPMMLYRMSPSERRWKAFVLHLLTTTDDDRATFLGGAVSFPGQ